MKRFIFLLLTLFACYLLQCTLIPLIPIPFFSVNLLLVLTITMGFLTGRRVGLYLGFFAGLLLDLTVGTALGFHAMLYSSMGYFFGILRDTLVQETILFPIFFTMAGELVFHTAVYIFRIIRINRISPISYFRNIVLPEMLLSMVAALFLYGFLVFMIERFGLFEPKGGIRYAP